MECPRCSGGLTTHTDDGVEIETCGGCRGTWLDHEELGRLLEGVGVSTGSKQDGQNDFGDRPSGGRMLCPRCGNQQLAAFEYLGDSGVELDQCLACGGLWLDGGEREKIEGIISGARQDAAEDSRHDGNDSITSSPIWRWLQVVGNSLAVFRAARLHRR